MNRDRLENYWKQFKYTLKARWIKRSDHRRGVIAGGQVLPASRIQKTVAEAGVEYAETSPRRLVLRGALAMGCGVFLPISLLGCDARKDANSSGGDSSGGDSASGDSASPPALSEDAAAPATSGKASQASVEYQAQPKGEQKCAGCMHFEAGLGTCRVVEGQVSPEGWCTLWAKSI